MEQLPLFQLPPTPQASLPLLRRLFEQVRKDLGNIPSEVISFAFGYAIGDVLSRWSRPLADRLEQTAWHIAPVAQLALTIIAETHARGLVDYDTAKDEAQRQGYNEEKFKRVVEYVKTRLSAALAVDALNRGVINEQQFRTILKRQGWDDESIEAFLKPVDFADEAQTSTNPAGGLRYQLPSWQEIMEALLEGQITVEEAKKWYAAAGGHPQWFWHSYHTRGQAPTPTQLLDLVNRGIIEPGPVQDPNPEAHADPRATTYVQGFLEGPWRNKWLRPFYELRWYYPPPRTVTAMLRAGAIDIETARRWFQRQGVRPDEVDAFIRNALHTKHEKERDLAKDDILSLYETRTITRDQAASYLRALGYEDQETQWLLSLADFRRERRLRDQAIARIRSDYVNWRISMQDASVALDRLAIPADERTHYLDIWTIEREANRPDLTVSQWQQALRRGIVSREEFIQEMTRRGYSDREAEILAELATPPARPA